MGKMMKMMQGGGASRMMEMMKEIICQSFNMILLDGKKTSNDIKDEIALEVSEIVNNGGKKPHLAAILVEIMVQVKLM